MFTLFTVRSVKNGLWWKETSPNIPPLSSQRLFGKAHEKDVAAQNRLFLLLVL